MNSRVPSEAPVGVDLITEQKQAVRPLFSPRLKPARQRPEGVDSETLRMRRRGQGIGLALRIAYATGAEDQTGLSLVLPRVDRARRPTVVRRPDPLAVEGHLVRPHRALLEVVQNDQRVVVSLDAERALAPVEHDNLTGRSDDKAGHETATVAKRPGQPSRRRLARQHDPDPNQTINAPRSGANARQARALLSRVPARLNWHGTGGSRT